MERIRTTSWCISHSYLRILKKTEKIFLFLICRYINLPYSLWIQKWYIYIRIRKLLSLPVFVVILFFMIYHHIIKFSDCCISNSSTCLNYYHTRDHACQFLKTILLVSQLVEALHKICITTMAEMQRTMQNTKKTRLNILQRKQNARGCERDSVVTALFSCGLLQNFFVIILFFATSNGSSFFVH